MSCSIFVRELVTNAQQVAQKSLRGLEEHPSTRFDLQQHPYLSQ